MLLMVKIKGKTPKQYHRDNYEKNKERVKAERRERYAKQRDKKFYTLKFNGKQTVLKADGVLIIKAKHTIFCKHEEDDCPCMHYADKYL